ncbi:hypothetical protein PYW07_005439 [Mythimna separata]|uniref:CUB domain-containing protein n=1 Tax=Mythimna separata TaxID=271217 RepID=A0AAD8DPZ2_MYTSE|nr:hypothetical protein PYW07_005439 [Mythimna separata]
MSPGFPELWGGEQDCNITIEKTHAGIMQLRIDFLHFTIGQPNRTTGDCDEDAMILGDGDSKFTLCGQNHGQHVYHTLSTGSEKREDGDLPGTKTISLSMRMRGGDMPRIWLMRVAQMPLAHTAPHHCLQYYTADNVNTKTISLSMRMRGGDMPRIWLMRVAQMPLAHTAPHHCLQYYTADNGEYCI